MSAPAPTFSVNTQGVVDFVGPLGHAADQVRGAFLALAAPLTRPLQALVIALALWLDRLLLMARKGH